MIRIILTLTLICFSAGLSSAQQQKVFFGISSSLDYNSYILVDEPEYFSYIGKLNYSGGFVMGYTIRERISIRWKLNYSTKNYEEFVYLSRLPQFGDTDPFIREDAKIKHTNQFIDLPVEVNYKLNAAGKRVDILASAGLVNSFQIGHRIESSFSRKDRTYSNYLLSQKAGVGFLFKKGNVGIYVEPQTRFYITKVHRYNQDQNPIHFGLEIQLLKI